MKKLFISGHLNLLMGARRGECVDSGWMIKLRIVVAGFVVQNLRYGFYISRFRGK